MSNNPRHILVVDDEEEVRETLRSVLKSLDYIPHTAAGGAEALEVLKNQPIDVVYPISICRRWMGLNC